MVVFSEAVIIFSEYCRRQQQEELPRICDLADCSFCARIGSQLRSLPRTQGRAALYEAVGAVGGSWGELVSTERQQNSTRNKFSANSFCMSLTRTCSALQVFQDVCYFLGSPLFDEENSNRERCRVEEKETQREAEGRGGRELSSHVKTPPFSFKERPRIQGRGRTGGFAPHAPRNQETKKERVRESCMAVPPHPRARVNYH